MTNILEVTDASIQEFLKGGQDVIAYFYGLDCPNCPRVSELLETMASGTDDSVTFIKTSMIDSPNAFQQYGVLGVPTILSFKNGVEDTRITGSVSEEDLKALLSKISP